MIKVKQLLITLAVVWLVCYAAMILLIGVILPPSSSAGDLSTRPMVNPVNAVAMVSGFVTLPAPSPVIGQSEPVDLFTWPILGASLLTIFAILALACGLQIIRIFGSVGYRY